VTCLPCVGIGANMPHRMLCGWTFFTIYGKIGLRLIYPLAKKKIPVKELFFLRRRIELEYFFVDRAPLSTDNSRIYHAMGELLYNEASTLTQSDPQRCRELFRIAFLEYDSHLSLEPESYKALIHWGDALSDFALLNFGTERDFLMRLAQEKYTEAKLKIPIVTPNVSKLDSPMRNQSHTNQYNRTSHNYNMHNFSENNTQTDSDFQKSDFMIT